MPLTRFWGKVSSCNCTPGCAVTLETTSPPEVPRWENHKEDHHLGGRIKGPKKEHSFLQNEKKARHFGGSTGGPTIHREVLGFSEDPVECDRGQGSLRLAFQLISCGFRNPLGVDSKDPRTSTMSFSDETIPGGCPAKTGPIRLTAI